VRSDSQYCPVARGAEIYVDRWTPLIVRKLELGASRCNETGCGLPVSHFAEHVRAATHRAA
jgi:DNA-binding HxlR family transcriptional regulator